jgi:hypothetical protein
LISNKKEAKKKKIDGGVEDNIENCAPKVFSVIIPPESELGTLTKWLASQES